MKAIKEKDLDSFESAKKYGSQFVGDVCDDCKKKIEGYFLKHFLFMKINPKKHSLAMSKLLCKDCKKRLLRKTKRKE